MENARKETSRQWGGSQKPQGKEPAQTAEEPQKSKARKQAQQKEQKTKRPKSRKSRLQQTIRYRSLQRRHQKKSRLRQNKAKKYLTPAAYKYRFEKGRQKEHEEGKREKDNSQNLKMKMGNTQKRDKQKI